MELVVNYLYSESCNGFERLKPYQKLKPFNDEYWGAFQAIGFASPLACPLNCPFGFTDQQDIEKRGVYFYGTIINQNQKSIEQADSKVIIVLQEREPFVRLKFLIVILLGVWASILAGVWFASCPNTNQIKTIGERLR
ncbi:hypothetical protein [Nostoc commune]|uniref:hypothetical protein n=1 Tax=Nostoc commune TaxID=1178 RepID=UPI0018C64332|nr:hypothetical protein [Nostoc commune]MBG1262879.1 hypothetical protein [Nostoc commune BAE]